MIVKCSMCERKLGELKREGNKLKVEGIECEITGHVKVRFDDTSKTISVEPCEKCLMALVEERTEKVLWLISKKALRLTDAEWKKQLRQGHWYCNEEKPYHAAISGKKRG